MGSINIVGGPVAVSAPGSMAIALPDGVTPSVSVNGGAYGPIGSALSVPANLVIADAATNTAPDIIVERHTTSATPTTGFGLLALAAELTNASSVVKRVATMVASFLTASPTTGNEEVGTDFQVMSGGTLLQVARFAYAAAGSGAQLLLGPVAQVVGFKVFNGPNRMDLMVSGGTVITLLAASITMFDDTIMSAKRFMGARGAAIAVALSITLGTDGNAFPLTAGTGTLNAINVNGMQAGTWFILECASGITITHNVAGTGATIQTSSLASIVTSGTGRAVWCYYNGTVVQALA